MIKYLIGVGVVTLLFLLLNACVGESIKKPTRTYEEEILLKHNIKEGQYTIEFQNPKQEWTVYQGVTPKEIDWTQPVAKTSGEMLMLPALEDVPRTFFALVSKKDTVLLSERRLALEGASNFRDLGGIPTKDGRYVKWNKIFRSNRLSDLSKRDLRFLKKVGLETVADFRYEVEIEKHPDRIPQGADYYKYPIGGNEGGTRYLEMKQKVREGITAPEVKDLFVGIMEEFTATATSSFAPVFDHLFEKEVPLVFHCTGGKDRTGYMSAMILSALDVDREVIMQEYLMSNYYRYNDNRSNFRKGLLVGIDREVLATGFLVKEDYLKEVWRVIDEEYGGTDQYLEKKYGLTPEKRAQLKEMYTYEIDQIVPDIVLNHQKESDEGTAGEALTNLTITDSEE
ncbi:MAG: tyrosine-protein phosphatase [Bacteroidota bacterium]